jgi:lipoic acid synthetase
VLVPDFGGKLSALDVVLGARPDILNHNMETVSRLYSTVRRGADYKRSLALLRHASESGFTSKTGVMVGLGETLDELWQLFDDLVAAGCCVLTLGQYLQPTSDHRPIARFYHPDEFASLKAVGEAKGLAHVESGPRVRSSYNAAAQARFVSRTDDEESQYEDI